MYIALTGKNFNGDTKAATADERNIYFQLMYRSVGQVMHLVEDLASPAHVRNDIHGKFPGVGGYDLYEFVLADPEHPENFNPNWLNGYSTFFVDQFSDFWDSPQGLAGFTNHNFISQNTNLDNRDINGNLFYPSPGEQGVITTTEEITDQFGHKVQVQVDYVRNVVEDFYTQNSFTNDKLAAFSVFNFVSKELLNKPVYSVNNSTIKSAASILVPRAVGYSAGVLDYFFRGDLDAHLINNTQFVITNESFSAEDMDGTFTLYYDDKDGVRKPVEGASGTFSLPFPSDSAPLTLTAPTDAQEPGKYILVFNGQIGAEQNAIAGKVVDLSVQHVFIIQDSLALNSTPSEESLPADPNIYLQEGAQKIWPTDHQVLTGRFVTHGTIKSISLVAAPGPGAQLYLDGINYPSGVWNIGDTQTEPSQWRVEGPARALEVVMKNDTVIRQGLFSIASFSSIRDKTFFKRPCDRTIPFNSNCNPDGTLQIMEFDDVDSTTYTNLTLNAYNGGVLTGSTTTFPTLSISNNTSGPLSIPILDEFQIPDLGAFSPSISCCDDPKVVYALDGPSPPTGLGYVYVTHLVESVWPVCSSVNIQGIYVSYQINSYDDVQANENRYHLFLGPFGNSITIGNIHPVTETGAVGISNGCSDPNTYYNSLTVPNYIPLVLSGQIVRIYSQAEQDYLANFGIQPEQYSIILQ